jgi:pimeloyl-ACP methyl ester carboxylesterase
VTPGAEDGFVKAAFRLWLPEGDGALRGVAVLMPGMNQDGRWLAASPAWQAFARQERLGLLGVHLAGALRIPLGGGRSRRVAYDQADGGSGEALLAALGELARTHGRPEAAEAPLVLWGFSMGAQFCHAFACAWPERVAAFVAVKAGHYQAQAGDAARNVPGLFIIGERDARHRVEKPMRLFRAERARGARWAVAVEPRSGHTVGRSLDLSFPFLRGALLHRPGRDAPEPWLADIGTLAIYAQDAFPGDALAAAWLPDRAGAEAWRRFATVGQGH